MAIAAGISDGLGLGQNARAALITRGLAEIARLGAALGGQPETLMGLAGAGDLILTATGDLSRNRRVGLELAQRRPLEKILATWATSPKACVRRRKWRGSPRRRRWRCRSPSGERRARGRLTPAAAVEQLLSRDPKRER